VPAAVQIVYGGALQFATAGTAVATDPTVRVIDILGTPLPNVPVTFTVASGGGTVVPAQATTDAEGRASAHWVVGPTIGANSLSARIAGGIPPVAFSASSLAILTSETATQSGVVNSVVPHPPTVVARDALGNPVVGLEITFSGAGTASPARVITDANGRATTSWTLATYAAPFQFIRAWPGPDETGVPALFSCTALPGPPVSLEFLPPETAMSIPVGFVDHVGPIPTDAFGNRIADSHPMFTSSDEAVARVTDHGVEGYIEGVSAGWTHINASLAGLSAQMSVMIFNWLPNLTDAPWGLALLDDNTALVTFESGANVKRLDLRSGAVIATTPVSGHPVDVVVDPTGTVAYVASRLGYGVSVVQLSSGTIVDSIAIPAGALRLRLSPDARRLYVSDEGGSVSVIETATRSIIATFTGFGPVNGLAVSHDGSTLYAASMTGTVYRASTTDGRILASVVISGRPQDIVLSRDESELYEANEIGIDSAGGWVDALDAATLQPKARVMATGAFGLGLTPDGNTLVVAGDVLTLISRTTMTAVGRYPLSPLGTGNRLAFTSDGRPVLTSRNGWIGVLPKP
jgi:hypothetical protein